MEIIEKELEIVSRKHPLHPNENENDPKNIAILIIDNLITAIATLGPDDERVCLLRALLFNNTDDICEK